MMDSTSLLQDLLLACPQIRAQVYFKTSLTALSHAIEDLVLLGTENPLVIANFQQERFYRQETGRYRRIAQRTDHVYVLAAPETDFASSPAPYATIGLDPNDELAQEWHLVVIGETYSACLICREYAAPIDTNDLDSARQFHGFWTFDPEVTRQAAGLLLQHIRRYRPDLTQQIDRAKQCYQLTTVRETLFTPRTTAIDAQRFVDRLVIYLQASQYKQIKAYRRILGEERRERLVNQITTKIRQSLNREDILATAVQEVSQVFASCRCFAYVLPQESSGSFGSFGSFSRSSETRLNNPVLNSDYQLATHPLFQAILNRGDLVAIADVSQDSGVQSHLDLQQKLEQAQIQACLLVPVFDQQRCLAVLELHCDFPCPWPTDSRDLLLAIAAQVGIALLQADAFSDLQQANQQLVSIKQAQSNLVAIVGHELRTPLSTIQVCLESLDSEPDMPLEFQKVMVEVALGDSGRLRRLIEDFLLLSSLEGNLSALQIEPIDLADALLLTVSHLKAVTQPDKLPTITVDLPAMLPLAVGDNDVLFQLFSKILENACKFTPTTGTITVTVEEVQPNNFPEKVPTQAMLEIQISDTGRGIESDQLENIFDRFYQEEGFLRRAVGGAGLGLAICRQLVRRLGGQIWATSQGRGQGSQFYVTVPVMVD
jgi:DICT domain-containing protein/signal transduction histidine kinase